MQLCLPNDGIGFSGQTSSPSDPSSKLTMDIASPSRVIRDGLLDDMPLGVLNLKDGNAVEKLVLRPTVLPAD